MSGLKINSDILKSILKHTGIKARGTTTCVWRHLSDTAESLTAET